VADSGGGMREEEVGEFWTWKLEENGKSLHKSTTLVITAAADDGRYSIILTDSVVIRY